MCCSPSCATSTSLFTLRFWSFWQTTFRARMCSLLGLSSDSHVCQSSTVINDSQINQVQPDLGCFDFLDDIDLASFLESDALPSPENWLLSGNQTELHSTSTQQTTSTLTGQLELQPQADATHTAARHSSTSTKTLESSRKGQKRYRERQKARQCQNICLCSYLT